MKGDFSWFNNMNLKIQDKKSLKVVSEELCLNKSDNESELEEIDNLCHMVKYYNIDTGGTISHVTK
jgi:hypothetical protein